jgi:hypothetical protein
MPVPRLAGGAQLKLGQSWIPALRFGAPRAMWRSRPMVVQVAGRSLHRFEDERCVGAEHNVRSFSGCRGTTGVLLAARLHSLTRKGTITAEQLPTSEAHRQLRWRDRRLFRSSVAPFFLARGLRYLDAINGVPEWGLRPCGLSRTVGDERMRKSRRRRFDVRARRWERKSRAIRCVRHDVAERDGLCRRERRR